jgi:hypothetical protein
MHYPAQLNLQHLLQYITHVIITTPANLNCDFLPMCIYG